MILNFSSTQHIKKQLRAGTVAQGQVEPLPSMLEALGSKFPVFPRWWWWGFGSYWHLGVGIKAVSKIRWKWNT